jgi:hypothetical protein
MLKSGDDMWRPVDTVVLLERPTKLAVSEP